ncbi:MAG: aminotransferase class V-fold PLP-dependent enzyme, partial [Candidatus Parcubacteria bacterium]|nr:aminotransferase class V-fold PLP-dependent enzyme [Candidatus Parcubacteria bacterium]
GTIQPIAEISKIVHKKNVLFHTDACQAAGYEDLNVSKLGVDLMTVNGSKIYGPKGIGFLYVKKGIKLQPILFGGEQEKRMRPGTENVPAIVGLARAFELVQKDRIKESKRLTILRDYFIKKLLAEIPKTFLNGHPVQRLPNNINVSILGVEGESVVLYLDEAGVACSTGSACTSESLEPSHVIMALGRPHQYGHGSLRFTLGKCNTKRDIDYVLKILPAIIKKLRSISAVKA